MVAINSSGASLGGVDFGGGLGDLFQSAAGGMSPELMKSLQSVIKKMTLIEQNQNNPTALGANLEDLDRILKEMLGHSDITEELSDNLKAIRKQLKAQKEGLSSLKLEGKSDVEATKKLSSVAKPEGSPSTLEGRLLSMDQNFAGSIIFVQQFYTMSFMSIETDAEFSFSQNNIDQAKRYADPEMGHYMDNKEGMLTATEKMTTGVVQLKMLLLIPPDNSVQGQQKLDNVFSNALEGGLETLFSLMNLNVNLESSWDSLGVGMNFDEFGTLMADAKDGDMTSLKTLMEKVFSPMSKGGDPLAKMLSKGLPPEQ